MDDKLKLKLIGIISGFFTGLVGGFGAAISILGLKKYFRMNQKEAQATSMSITFITAIITIVILFFKVKLDIKFMDVVILIIFNFIGLFIGYHIFNKVRNKTLNIIFGITLLISGIMMIWN